MKIYNQIPLLYFAKRLYPNLDYSHLKQEEIKLLGIDASIRLSPDTDIDDMTLNDAINTAVENQTSAILFEEIQKPFKIRYLSERLEEATSLCDLENIFPTFLINRRLGEIATEDSGYFQIDEDDEIVVYDNGYFKFIDMLDQLTAQPFKHDRNFGFARFYKYCGFSMQDERSYSIFEVIELLSLALDLGIIEADNTNPQVEFKFAISKKAYTNVCGLTDCEESKPVWLE